MQFLSKTQHRLVLTVGTFLWLSLFFLGCKDEIVINETVQPIFPFTPTDSLIDGQYGIAIPNPIKFPLRVTVYDSNKIIPDSIINIQNHVIAPLDTLCLTIPWKDTSTPEMPNFKYKATLGDPETYTYSPNYVYRLPFKNVSAEVIQGHNGSYSHNDNFNRYAIDFEMKLKDTIRAARNGIVIGLQNQHTIGGADRAYYKYANTVYIGHNDGSIALYVHLYPGNNLVALGDTVNTGQPIGLNGMTGFTSSPHLHFNLLKPIDTKIGAESIPVNFQSVKGEDLVRGMMIHPQLD